MAASHLRPQQLAKIAALGKAADSAFNAGNSQNTVGLSNTALLYRRAAVVTRCGRTFQGF
jgi:hypothetical protein